MEESEGRQKLLNYAYFYLNIRPRTEKEVRDYLLQKAKKFSLSPEHINGILGRLRELALLNDQAFVRWYVEGKFASSSKSSFLLRQELQRLGVAKDILDEYFAGRSLDEMAPARAALALKWRRFATISDKSERFQKAASYLVRRGFSYDIVKKTIAEYEGEG